MLELSTVTGPTDVVTWPHFCASAVVAEVVLVVAGVDVDVEPSSEPHPATAAAVPSSTAITQASVLTRA
jgi:hypothetical protein